MNDLESRLRDQLRHQAGAAATPGSSLSDVVAHGRRRQRRARLATTGLMAAGILGGALGAYAWIDSRDGASTTDQAVSAGTDDDVAGSASETAAAIDVSPLDFRRIDAVDPLGSVHATATTDDGVVYVLSTAPGTTDSGPGEPPAPQTLHRSRTEGGWEPLPVGDELRLQTLATSANRLYAVGTAPSAAAVDGESSSEAVVAWSDDGGETWTDSVLPIRPEGLDASVPTWLGDAEVAAGDAGVVVVATTWGDVEVESRLPDGTDLSFGYQAGPDGVVVYGPPPATIDEDVRLELEDQLCPEGWTFDVPTVACTAPDSAETMPFDPVEAFSGLEPAETYGWDELGMSPDVGRLFSGVPQVYYSADGERFELVGDQLVEDGAWFGHEVVATPTGFLAGAQVYDGSGRFGHFDEPTARTVLWTSADGRSWTRVDPPTGPELEWVTATGRLGDRLALVGHAPSGHVVATTADGTSWTTSNPVEQLQAGSAGTIEVQSATVGDAGIAMALQEQVDPLAAAGGVDIAVDGYTLRILDEAGRAVLLDSAGAEVAAVETVWELPAGAGQPSTTVAPTGDGAAPPATAVDAAPDAVIPDRATGEPLVTVPYETIWTAIEEATASAEQTAARGWIAWSPDGATWSLTDLTDELRDRNVAIGGVYVGGSTITVELRELVESDDAEGGVVETARTLVAPIPG